LKETPDPLPEKLERLFAAERSRPPLPPPAIDRGWDQLSKRLPMLNEVPGSTTPLGSVASMGRVAWLLTGLGVGVLVVAGTLVMKPQRSRIPESAATPVPGPTREPAAIPTVVAPPPSAGSSAVGPVPSPLDPPIPRAQHPPKRLPLTPEPSRPRSQPTGPGLSEERALVERARDALARGDGATALRTTEEYRSTFPSGELSEEAEFLQIASLARLGRSQDAARATEAFRKRYPNSPLEQNLPGQ
jgi:hypothetical protein